MTLSFEALNYTANTPHGTYFVSRVLYGSSLWSACRVHGSPGLGESHDVERLVDGVSYELAIATCNAREAQLNAVEVSHAAQ